LNITEKNINRRMEIQPEHDVQYTPLSIALWSGELDIAEHYLKDFADSLDVTVINTHGSTALLEALTQYKKHRFLGGDEQRAERYKKIIMELIKRSPADSLYAETKKSYISVLEVAINTFDIEIVKAIVEKMKKSDDAKKEEEKKIQSLKISSDELSPLYYAINRCSFVSSIISTGKTPVNGRGNINWKKFNVPGIFIEDKKVNYQNMISDPLWNETEELNIYMCFGKSGNKNYRN
jgi:uncharacterized protein (UPF0335 family)